MRASTVALRMLLSGEGGARVRYGGDRMWPALRHGQSLRVVPLAERGPVAGEVVLAVEGGIPDLLRVESAAEDVAVAADSGDKRSWTVSPRDILGRMAESPRRGRFGSWHRVWLDVREAWTGRPDAESDPAESVRDKYDEQAVFYARSDAPPLDPALASRIAASVTRGGRVLVAGSGTGREAFALEAMGFEVAGIDFSPRMVEIARAAATERGSRAAFVAADLRRHEERENALAAVVFTYDVYSFLPSAPARLDVLSRLARALAPGGALFLSARRRSKPGDLVVLTIQWLAALLRGRRSAWGDSHTRWLDGDGRLRRSFVHVFTPRALDAELARAGFELVDWKGGHGHYRFAGGARA